MNPSFAKAKVNAAGLAGRSEGFIAFARRVYPAAGWAGRAQRLLFVVRQLIHYPHARQWIHHLGRPPMDAVVARNPYLYRKIIRPYVSRDWPDALKVAALIHHYRFLSRKAPGLFGGICSEEGVELTAFAVGQNERLRLRLRMDSKFRKEGEATLELISEKFQCRVYCLSFVIAPGLNGRSALIVGAVSGLPMGADKNIIKYTAKAIFGLRPKALLLIAVQELAQVWGIGFVLGVGSRIHTSRHASYVLNRSRQFDIAYDEFWQEAGGVRRGDGFYTLPSAFVERTPAAIPAHKRSLYRQRYAWIDGFRATLRERLTAPPAGRGLE